jgi:uncharacterized protein (TIGR02246 family)
MKLLQTRSKMAVVVAIGALSAMLAVGLAIGPALLVGASEPRDAALHSAAQNQKNNKKQRDHSDELAAALPDPQAIDLLVSQMLAAWQIGDVDTMHKYYDEDVAAVSGSWEPPLLGWRAYSAAYQKQHARTQSSRLDRTNTFTKVVGDTAWVTYQWQFSGQVDGQPATALGHTTLVLQKRDGRWLIVLNHTSAIPAGAPPSSAATTEPPSATPASHGPGE